MWVLGPIGFVTPWVLLGFLALPILWFLLRAVPPAPLIQRFPGIALLLGLKDEEVEADRTPWWLLLLRALSVAALIVAFAGPVLNPRQDRSVATGPLMILMDASWASAPDWTSRIGRVHQALDAAQADNRTTCLIRSTALESGCTFRAASELRPHVSGLKPASFEPDMAALNTALVALEGEFDTLWLSDGLARDGRAEVLETLMAKGAVSVFETGGPISALSDTEVTENGVAVTVIRRDSTEIADLALLAHGPDPAGVARILARKTVTLGAGEATRVVTFDLPPELRNRVTRFEIEGLRSAGAKRLSDDSLRRREVALVTVREAREGLQLLSQLHYLRAALSGKADVIEGALSDLLQANPNVIVLADIAHLSGGEVAQLLEWVNSGGTLLRFAGPNLAASDVARRAADPLLPVRLRAGGRTIGGAMSWGEPKALRPFAEASPFYGLPVPADVTVSAQVMAQPDPDLAARVIASLADGTPLVTRNRVGQGQVVLFHVTANAEWSTLPLSGLFVSMLERLSISARSAEVEAEALMGQMLTPISILDGFGEAQDTGTLAPVPGESFVTARPSAAVPPGLYEARESRVALNAVAPDTELRRADWPANIPVAGIQSRSERPLTSLFLIMAISLLAVDLIASLWVSGRLIGPRALPVILLVGLMPHEGRADALAENFAISAASDVTLAYVRTGDAVVDDMSEAGLVGLSMALAARTSVEPAPPVGVDLEADPLGFFPMLYWPVTKNQPTPSAAAYTKLNAYLRTGGVILFDTRDADLAQYGGTSPNGTRLQALARPLDIPALEPIPEDHVLTRSFYLLRTFPGRHAGGAVWTEAAPVSARAEGMPFRNLNDNVSPVILGGGDWAAAWATDSRGFPRVPVGRGYDGDHQRELAYRFGVNLVVYILTGNYKSDQVHVPALLERLGE